MVRAPAKPRFLEFFAGAGLVRLALEPRWRCVWANDLDPRKAAVYRANFGAEDLVPGDVAALTADELPSPVEMAWASFPCQDLSLAGWRRGMSAKRSGAFWPFWRLMRELFERGRRPPLIVVENVVGLLSGSDFAGLCEALATLEMRVGALVIDARRFLPQSRPRVFVVAADSRIDCSRFTAERAGEGPWVTPTLRRAAERLPPTAAKNWVWWRLPAPGRAVVPAAELIERDPGVAPRQPPEETERLLEMMSPAHRARVETERRRNGFAVGFLYRRMRDGRQRAEVRFDGLAGCLRTPAGGSSRQSVLIIENGRVRSRLLTPREAARLMGAPESFRLPENYNDAYRAMGDGVAVPAVRRLSAKLLLPLVRASKKMQG